MSKILTVVKQAFQKHPVIANSVIYGTLFVGAEFSQQALTKKILPDKPQPLDSPTLGRYAFYGIAMQGPLLTVWYRWLDSQFAGTATKVVLRKLVLDQFMFTPQLLVLFYVAMSVMEQKKDVLEECKEKFLPTFKTSCMFWLPAQSINFFLIPAAFRVVYVGTCSFAWVNILCWIKRQEY